MLDNMSIHKYYHRTKETVQNIKTLAKQNSKYRDHWEAINSFVDEDALAAFIAGLRGNYFGHAQAARPKDIEDAYAFLCKFKSQEINASQMDEGSKFKQNKPPFANNKPKEDRNSQITFQKQPFKPKTEFEKKETPEPMEIDPSLRSRLSYTKTHINTKHEAEQYSSNKSSDKNEEVNFCQVEPI